MRLPLLNIIDETLELYRSKREDYQQIRKELKYILIDLISKDTTMMADIASRVKTEDSLKEKLIRNRFYLDYASSKDILDNLHDIVGLKIECRFIEEEAKIYELVKKKFNFRDNDGYYYNERFDYVKLDLNAPQPQHQRNGFTIYRVDGFYEREDEKINFELQIKSMVNSFWGDIEHKLVYKSTKYYVYDTFMKKMLASIKDNLATIDSQLEIIYDEMENSNRNQIGFTNEKDFEKMLSKSINDLFTDKLKESIGFAINIKNTSDILGHYIFVKNMKDNFASGDAASSLMNIFRTLGETHISFTDEIELESEFVATDTFTHIMGDYFIKVMNKDFDWYVFFQMLFALEAGNNIEDYTLFIHILYDFMVDDAWLEQRFSRLAKEEASLIQEYCTTFLAACLCEVGSIKIIYNDKMKEVSECFVTYVEELEKRVISVKDFEFYREFYFDELKNKISGVF